MCISWLNYPDLFDIDYFGSFLYDIVLNISESKASSLKPHLQLFFTKLEQEVSQASIIGSIP